jgi:hypothetical protein
LSDAGAGGWLARMADPQILIDKAAQAGLLTELHRAGQNGALLLEQARQSLVGAIHLGLVLATVIAAVGVWRAHRVPPIKLARTVEPTLAAD